MRELSDELAAIARRYQRFASVEVRGSSPVYEQLALAVAGSTELLAFLKTLPPERRQPNLFLAAVRQVVGVPRNADELIEVVRSHAVGVRHIMQSRTTQTNEPGRCAVLLPVLAGLRQPLALIEVGASAGLCLLPDLYSYQYGEQRLDPIAAYASAAQQGSAAPVFHCHANAATPLPFALPTVVWRQGLDLNPLNVRSASDMAWLQTLVWPEHQQRAQRLNAAIAIARCEPPQVRRGNLLTDLPALAALAPRDAQLVVFHSAVLGYIASQSDRDAFAQTVARTGAIWISNESPATFPEIARRAPASASPGQFLLSVDGKPIAWTGPHGQSIDWFSE